ncbi:MAPEG family protein [Desertibaculum subflavum]|uniref:MAPEG family protein n=1 Tax=Desertibaculum subflavum TaxID=2268458 RepID=UPI000E671D1D
MSVAIMPVYAGILGLVLIGLSLRVIRYRLKHRVGLGDGGEAGLRQAMRMQGNFIEYVPLALILMLCLELMAASAGLLHGLGVALVVARVAHALGIAMTDGASVPRFVGTVGTFGVLVVGALASLGLALGMFP